MDGQIQELIQTYQRSLNEADLDLVKAVYSDDAMFIGAGFPTATGIEEIVASYTVGFSKLDLTAKFDIEEVELSDDLGFVRTRSHGTIAPKGQTPQDTVDRQIFVVKKIDGRWKFYRYMFNAEVKE